MIFSTRLRLNSQLSFAVMLIMIPVLVWSLATATAVKKDDDLADEIQVKIYERIALRDEFILNQQERSKQQWFVTTKKTAALLHKAAGQMTDREERLILAEMQKNFDNTVAIFGRILVQSESTNRAGSNNNFNESELGKRLFTQLVLRASALQEASYQLQKVTERRLEYANRRAILITTLFVFLLSVTTCINTYFLNRYFRKRLEALHSGARIIASGNLDYRIATGESDEFADLAENINSMTATVQKKTGDLLLSRKQLNNLSQQVPGILFQARLSCDGHFSIPYASDAMLDIYGLPPDAGREDAAPIFELFHPDDRDGLMASFHNSAQSLTSWEYEYRILLPKKGLRWCHGIARPQKCADGSIIWSGIITDITDRTLLERDLKMFNNTIDNAFDAVQWITPDARILYANTTACRILGYSRDELTQLSVGDIDPVFPMDQFGAYWAESKQGRGSKLETIHRTKDGREFPVEIAVSFHHYGDQEINCCIIRDISERKQAEEALRKAHLNLQTHHIELEMQNHELLITQEQLDRSRASYFDLYDLSPVGYLVLDEQGLTIKVNLTITNLVGVERSALLHTPLSRFIFSDDQDTFYLYCKNLTKAGTVQSCEVRLLNGNQETVWTKFEGITAIDAESNATTLKIVVSDINDLKQAEEQLHESNLRFSTIFYSSPIAVGISNLETGIYNDVNNAFLELFGIRRDEIIGHTSTELGLWPDLKERTTVFELLKENGRVMQFEGNYRHSSGIIGNALVSAELIELGGQMHILVMVDDITERKRMELELAGSKDILERQVLERTASLSRAIGHLNQEIDERKRVEADLLNYHQKLEAMTLELTLTEERERDRIAGELHDQVGQRLILGKMKLGAMGCDASAARCLHDIEELEQIIDLSIQDIRSLTFQLRPPLLATAGLEAALQWLGEEFRENYGLQVTYYNDDQPKPLSYESRSTVYQAAREMLLNTVKHAGATHIGITICRNASMLTVVISDNGCGFDIVEAAKKKSRSGGFGLFNVQRRIELMGGSVTINSHPGSGTSATITAPLDGSYEG